MYYEKDIKGDKDTWIAQKATEFIFYNEFDDKKLDNIFAWVEFGTVYSEGYSHTFINNANNALYMVAVHRIFAHKAVEIHFICLKTGRHRVYDASINEGVVNCIERGFFN